MLNLITLSELDEKLESSTPKNILVMFRTSWCKNCEVDEIKVKDYLKHFSNQFDFYEIDVDQQKLWREDHHLRYQIDSVPTYFRYFGNKQISISLNKLPSTKQMQDWLSDTNK